MSRIDRTIGSVERGRDVTCIVGVPGSGKTHNMYLAGERGYLPSGMRVRNLGTVFARRLRQRGVLHGTKDVIRTLDPAVVDQGIREVIVEEIDGASSSRHPTAILCLPAYNQGGKLISLEDIYMQHSDRIDRWVIYMGHPDDIVERRRRGPRDRLIESPAAVEAHQLVLLDMGIRIADAADKEIIPYMSRPNITDANLAHLKSIMATIASK